VRYTRHELKQDRFAETAAGAMHWTVEHRSKLITGSIALIVLVLLIGGGWWYMNHRDQQASEALGHAMIIYNAPIRPAGIPADPQVNSYASFAERAQAAKVEFAKIADQYGSTRSGQYAKYFAALCDSDTGNTAAAEQGLKSVADSRNAEIASLAKFALATLYRGSNREADAIRLLKDLSDHPTTSVPKATAQFTLADIYQQKQPEEARKIYDQIAKEDPKSAAAELATSKSQALNK
jgi:predicted negative regulator of RcsB-dependent stress response